VGRPPDLVVVAINFWDLAMYTKHGLGLQPHLNEPLLHAWRRDFGDLLGVAQVQLCLTVTSTCVGKVCRSAAAAAAAAAA
jgi:hypothetical protein